MQYTISDVRPHPAIPGCSSVTLNTADPTGQFSTWKVSFDPKNGTPPVAGTVIETDLDKKIAQNGSEYYWIRSYQVAGQPTAQPNGPQQVAEALNIIPPAVVQNYASDLNADPIGDAIKTHDARTMSIVLQCIMKASANTDEADTFLRWYFTRLSNPEAVMTQQQTSERKF